MGNVGSRTGAVRYRKDAGPLDWLFGQQYLSDDPVRLGRAKALIKDLKGLESEIEWIYKMGLDLKLEKFILTKKNNLFKYKGFEIYSNQVNKMLREIKQKCDEEIKMLEKIIKDDIFIEYAEFPLENANVFMHKYNNISGDIDMIVHGVLTSGYELASQAG